MKSIFRFPPWLLFLVLINVNPLVSQWQSTGGDNVVHVHLIMASGTNLFAGTHAAGVFLSTNNGASWTQVNSGLTNLAVPGLAVSGTNLFAGTNGGGVFLSTNNGTSWTAINTGLSNTNVFVVAVSGTNVFAGTNGGGVFLSTNNGTSWTQINSGLTNTNVYSLAISGTNVFAGTNGGGVFLSTNNGTSWAPVNAGLMNLEVYALAATSTYLIAGTTNINDSPGFWRRLLSDFVTSVDLVSSDLPNKFDLEQNYPNPFNPATTISFSVLSRSFVSLKVFDALGREVSILLSEELPAGTYSQRWNATGLASGVYFYRLQAGNFVETRKLLLLR